MKRFVFSAFILVILLSFATGSALADGIVTGMSVSRAGGLTFTFSVTGYLSSGQLNGGYVQVQGGDSFKLHCVQKDEFTVICHAPGKIVDGVVVGFGGSTFWVEKEDMPKPHVDSAQYCYPIFGSNSDSNPTDFTTIGTRCDPTDDVWFFNYDDPAFGNIEFTWESDDSWVDKYCEDSYTPHGAGYYGQCYSKN